MTNINGDTSVILDENEYNVLKTVFDEAEYYKNAGLRGWKRAVMSYLPHNCSVAFENKVQKFLDTITSVE
jgi:hypothetical protein